MTMTGDPAVDRPSEMVRAGARQDTTGGPPSAATRLQVRRDGVRPGRPLTVIHPLHRLGAVLRAQPEGRQIDTLPRDDSRSADCMALQPDRARRTERAVSVVQE